MNKKTIKKISAVLLTAGMLLSLNGCTSVQISGASGRQQYEVTYLDLFDTVTVIKGYAEDEEAFAEQTAKVEEILRKYHQEADIYHAYDGISNLKTVNDSAGVREVEVSPELVELLLFGKEACENSNGKVNIFMGSVLELWHEARENALADPAAACLPGEEALLEASEHTDPENVVIDPERNTVFIADPEQRIDAGAVAKGYAAQKAIEILPEGYILNLGGNICASGSKADGSAWVVGVQDPDSDSWLERVELQKGAVVTSGDYQRYFVLDGKRRHHIIDPDTRMPAEQWRSVTIITRDSGTADFLSTALFLMDREEGTKLLEKYDSEAFWIAPDGTQYRSAGFDSYLSR